MLFSHSAAYAVRALTWLACQPKDSRWLANVVATQEGIPLPYLSKVLGVLKSQGLVSSIRGPNGGYTLTQAPDTITLLMISEMFDTEKKLSSCVLAYGECGKTTQCPFEQLWENLRSVVRNLLESTTIGTLASISLKSANSDIPNSKS